MTTVLLRHFLGAERVCRSASEGEPPSPEALLLKHSCGDHQVTSWLHTSSLEVQKRKKEKKILQSSWVCVVCWRGNKEVAAGQFPQIMPKSTVNEYLRSCHNSR